MRDSNLDRKSGYHADGEQVGIKDPSADNSIYAYQSVLWLASILIGSGMFHLAKLSWDGAEWEGPLSPRKPGLFGISAGLTVWSVDT